MLIVWKYNYVHAALQPPQSVNISDGSGTAGRLVINWQPPPSPPVNIVGYALRSYLNWLNSLIWIQSYIHRLSYTERQPKSIVRELIRNQSHDVLSYEFSQLPGDTSYGIVVVAVYSNNQRVPTTPVQYTLPGYGEVEWLESKKQIFNEYVFSS